MEFTSQLSAQICMNYSTWVCKIIRYVVCYNNILLEQVHAGAFGPSDDSLVRTTGGPRRRERVEQVKGGYLKHL